MDDALDRVRRIAGSVSAELVPDPRLDVFEIRTGLGAVGIRVDGASTIPAAEATLRERLRDAGVEAEVRIRTLPDPALGERGEALVRAPIAPVYRRPTMNSTQLTQYVLGSRLGLLSRRGPFWRIRGEDRHVGWVHGGFIVRGPAEWALAWERGTGGDPLVSLGAVVVDEADRPFARLPWGARFLQHAPGRVVLPDGRTGRLGEGEVVAVDGLRDRFPPRGESITSTARRWLGAPYLWGGVTPGGVDCSGFVQSVFRLHGLPLPRDSDMQVRIGVEVSPGDEWDDLVPGDLLFFAERRRVNHVALALGGPRIIHASAGNGGVELNVLSGDLHLERFLRHSFHSARRLLAD